MAGNEKLKMQLLGRDYAKILAKGRRNVDAGKCGASAVATRTRTEKKPRPAQARREGHISHSSDDEGGRSSLGKVKLGGQKRRCEELEDGVVEDEDEDEDGGVRMKKAAAYNADVKLGAKKRGNGYLDEVLADRARRKRKKGRRKDGAVDG